MKQTFQKLTGLYLAFLVGQVIFCLMAVYLNAGEPEAKVVLASFTEEPNFYKRVLLMLGLPLMGAAILIGRKRAQEGAMMVGGLESKLTHYRQTVILKCGIMEVVNLLAVSFAIADSDMSYLLYFAVGMLFFMAFRPSTESFIRKYELSPQEALMVRESARL